jgi:hypothetical protein
MSGDDVTVDDILDSLNSNSEEIESIEERLDSLADNIPDETPTSEDVDARVRGTLEHLVEEDCDTDWCNEIREEMGIHTHDDDSDTETEAETGDSDDENSGEESESADSGSSGGDDGNDGDERPTNVFGEPI